MAMNLKEDEGEIIGLTVKEISHVIAPAVDGVLKGQQLDACYLIVKEKDPEDDDDDDTGELDVLMKKDAMSTDSAAPLRQNAKQGVCKDCKKEMSGEGDICKCMHKEETEIAKEPVVQNTEMVTPTVSDETKMELQRTLKELVANSDGMNGKSKLLLAKVAAYHGVDVPDVEDDAEEKTETSLDDVLSALQKLVPILVALQPKPSTPTPPAASPTPKPAPTASSSMANKEDVTAEDIKNVFPDAIEAAGGLGKAEATTLADEIRCETAKEVTATQEPLLTRVARILEKQREQHELDEYMSVLKQATKKIQSVHDEYSETKRSLLKAMGRDPNDLETE